MQFSKEIDRLGIKLMEGWGVFVLDFSAYCPDLRMGDLSIEASLSTEPCNEGVVFDLTEKCVLNHRYPNKFYLCLTGKHGRKLSKIGCVVHLPCKDLHMFRYLNLRYGFETCMTGMSIPISLHNMQEDAPYSALSASFDLSNPDGSCDLSIQNCKKLPDGGYKPFTYSLSRNCDVAAININRFGEEYFTLLTPKNTLEEAIESNYIVYSETVTVYSDQKENILMI